MQRMCLSLVLGLVLVGGAEAARPTKYQVTVNVSAGGSVTSSTGGISCPGTCSTSVNSGTAITFTATPDPGATFTGWGGACAGTSTTCSLTISGTTSVSAMFEGGGGGGGPTVEELQARIEALEASLSGLEDMLAGVSRGPDPYTGNDTLQFSGMNIQIVNGLGWTDGQNPQVCFDRRFCDFITNGLGNLIVGYNEIPYGETVINRVGSHNLIIGWRHQYSSHSALIAGQGHQAQDEFAALVGGSGNTASGGSYEGTIVGGSGNSVGAVSSTIVGGSGNSAGAGSFPLCGSRCYTSGNATVVGGSGNSAVGDNSVAVGGTGNKAGIYGYLGEPTLPEIYGHSSVVVGGNSNITTNDLDLIVGGDNIRCDDADNTQATTCGEGTLSPVD